MESGVGTLAALLRERGAQYPALAAYTEAIGRQIASGTWGGPPVTFTAAPHVWDADRDAAAAELALVAVNGVNLWTTIAVALDDVHVGHPQAFGPVDDPVDEERQRQAPQARAAAALRDVSSLPVELLCGLAVIRGVAVEPRANLAERMVADEMADAPRLAPCSVPLT